MSIKCSLCMETVIYTPEYIQAVVLEGSMLSFVIWNSTIEMWHLNENNAWEHRQSLHLGAYSDGRGLGGRPVYHKGS